MARLTLVLALAALLVAGASADRALLASTGDKAVKSGKNGAKYAAKACAKQFPGCICTGTVADGDLACDSCLDTNAGVVDGQCVCNEDYGTVTKRQMKAFYKANKGGKNNKHYAKYAKCFLCSDFDLVAVDGVCTLLV